MGRATKVYILFGAIGLCLVGIKVYLKKHKNRGRMAMNVNFPNFVDKSKQNQTKNFYKHYDHKTLNGPDSDLHKTTNHPLASFAHIFQVNDTKKEKKASKEAPYDQNKATYLQPVEHAKEANKDEEDSTWFFSYIDSENKDQEGDNVSKPNTINNGPLKFYDAFLDENQKVTHGSSIVMKLREPCTVSGIELKAGTLLYGQVSFIHNRILVDIHVAKHLGKIRSVRLSCYDTDFLLGIFCEGVHPVLKEQGNQLLDKIDELHLSDSKWIQGAEKIAADILRKSQKIKSFKLAEGRSLYVREK